MNKADATPNRTGRARRAPRALLAAAPRSPRFLFAITALLALGGVAYGLTVGGNDRASSALLCDNTAATITLDTGPGQNAVTISQSGGAGNITVTGACNMTIADTVGSITINGVANQADQVHFNLANNNGGWLLGGSNEGDERNEIEVTFNIGSDSIGVIDMVTLTGASATTNQVLLAKSGSNMVLRHAPNTTLVTDAAPDPDLTVVPQPDLFNFNGGNSVNGNVLQDNLDPRGNAAALGSATPIDTPVHANLGDGNDNFRGGSGNDIIYAGAGNDSNLDGQTGDDVIHGGDGDDLVVGNNGDDVLMGGCGNDDIRGGSGNDIEYEGDTCGVTGHNGNDTHDPPSANLNWDTVIYTTAPTDPSTPRAANLTVTADGVDANNDGNLTGGEDDDIGEDMENIVGGPGNDSLTASTFAGSTDNMISPGAGDDTLVAFGSGTDILNYGPIVMYPVWAASPTGFQTNPSPSRDAIVYSGEVTAGLDIDVAAQTVAGKATSTVQTPVFTGTWDYVFGTEHFDTISGTDGADSLHGRGGNDVISGGLGDDAVTAGVPDFARSGWWSVDGLTVVAAGITGGSGNDTITGGLGADSINGDGAATLQSAGGDDLIYGSTGPGTGSDGDGADVIRGGGGTDTIDGGAGDDDIAGDAGTTLWDTQTINLGGATGGTFTITSTTATGAIAYNATAATVQTALENLASIGVGNVVVLGGPLPSTDVVVRFKGTLAGVDRAQMTVNSGSLTGSPAVKVRSAGSTASGTANGLVSDVILGGLGADEIGGFTSFTSNTTGTVEGATDAADYLDGGDGTDQIYGSDGNDSIHGGADRDVLNGGLGDDTFHGGTANDGADSVRGNAGSSDYIEYTERTGSYSVIREGLAPNVSGDGNAGRCTNGGTHSCLTTYVGWIAGETGNDGLSGEGDDIWTDVELPAPASGVNAVDTDNTGIACDGRDIQITWTPLLQAGVTGLTVYMYATADFPNGFDESTMVPLKTGRHDPINTAYRYNGNKAVLRDSKAPTGSRLCDRDGNGLFETTNYTVVIKTLGSMQLATAPFSFDMVPEAGSVGPAAALEWATQPQNHIKSEYMAQALDVVVVDSAGTPITTDPAGGPEQVTVTFQSGTNTEGSSLFGPTMLSSTSMVGTVDWLSGSVLFGTDGRTFTDGVTTSGSATLTSATAAFTAADVGRRVIGTGIPTATHIAAYVNATTVTLSANATASASGVSVELDDVVRATEIGTYNLTASPTAGTWTTPPNSANSTPFSVTGGAPSQLVWTVQPTNTAPDAVIGGVPGVTVQVRDAYGNPAADPSTGGGGLTETITLQLTKGTTAGLNANAATDVIENTAHGLALNTKLQLTSAGTTELTTGTDYYVVGIQPNSFQLATTPNGAAVTWTTTGTISYALYALDTTAAGDENANLSTTVSVDWATSTATFTNLNIGETAFSYQFAAQYDGDLATGGVQNGLTASSNTFNIGNFNALVWTANPPATAEAGQLFSATVRVENGSGSPITTDPDGDGGADETITLTIFSQNSPSTPVGTLTASPEDVTWVDGNAVWTGSISIDKVGTYILTATPTVAGWTATPRPSAANSTAITITPDLDTRRLRWGTQHADGANVEAGTFMPVTVVAEDQYANRIDDDTTEITISRDGGPSNPLRSGAANATNDFTAVMTDGVADFTSNQLNIEIAGTGYDFHADDVTANIYAAIDDGHDFNITPDLDTRKLAWGTQPTLNANIEAGSFIPVTVRGEDQYGNLIDDDTTEVTISRQGGPANPLKSGAANATNDFTAVMSNGVATFVPNELNIEIAGLAYDFDADDVTANIYAAIADGNDFNITPDLDSRRLRWGTQHADGANVEAGTFMPVTVRAEDQYANLIDDDTTEITISRDEGPTNPLRSGAANATNDFTAVMSNGVADFTSNQLNIEIVGTGYDFHADDVTANIYAAIDDGHNFNITPDLDSLRLRWGTQPALNANIEAGSFIPVTVRGEDQYGNVNTGDNTSVITISRDEGPANPLKSGAANATNSFTATMTAGVATFVPNELNIEIAGTGYDFTADDDAGAPSYAAIDDGNNFNIVPDADTLRLRWGTQPALNANIEAGSFIPVTVRGVDQYGNVNTGDDTSVITIALDEGPANPLKSGAANATNTFTATMTDGIADFTINQLNIEIAGTGYDFTADDDAGAPSYAAIDDGNNFNITADLDTRRLVWGTQPALNANITAGAFIDVTVRGEDQYGNLIDDDTTEVTISRQGGPANPLKSGAANATNDFTAVMTNGVADFGPNDLNIEVVGSAYDFDANDVTANLYAAIADGNDFNIVAAAAHHLAWGSQFAENTDFRAGATITPVTVRVEDQFNNLVITSTATVTLAIDLNPADPDATLGSTSPLAEAAVAGIATFSDNGLNITSVADGYDFGATSPGLTAAPDGRNFDIIAASTKLIFIDQPDNDSPYAPGESIDETSGPACFKVAVVDDDDNVVTTDNTTIVTLTFVNNATGTAALTNASVTAVHGVAVFCDLSIDEPGQDYTVVGDDGPGGLDPTPTSNRVDIETPPAANTKPTVTIDIQVQEPGSSVWTTIVNGAPAPRTNAKLRARILTWNDPDGVEAANLVYTYEWWVNGIRRQILSNTTVLNNVYNLAPDGEADVANLVTVAVKAHDGHEFGPNAEAGVQVANTAPVATARSVSVQAATATAVRLRGTDDDNQTLKFRVMSAPSGGTLRDGGALITNYPHELATYGSSVTYTQTTAVGTDSFQFQAGDTQGSITTWSPTATVDVKVGTVTLVMDPPQVTNNGVNETAVVEPASGTTPTEGTPVKTSVQVVAPLGVVGAGYEILVDERPVTQVLAGLDTTTHEALEVQQDVIVREMGGAEIDPSHPDFAGMAAQPITLTFTIDESQVPVQVDNPLTAQDEDDVFVAGIIVYRNGTAVNPCPFANQCVQSQSRNGDNDVVIVVDAAHASSWNFAAPLATSTSILSGPEGAVNAGSPNNPAGGSVSFTFTSSVVPADFDCQLRRNGDSTAVNPPPPAGVNDTVACSVDGGAIVAGVGTGTFSMAGRPDDVYTFRVQSPDGGNIARRDFVVDRTAPNVSITSGPTGTTSSSSPTFTFTSNEPGSTYDCQLDLGAFVPCNSKSVTYAGVTPGSHIVTVRATDTVLNASATTRTFRYEPSGTPGSPPTTVRPRTGTPIRVAGNDRTETAELVSRVAFPDHADTVYIATQWDYADALSAGPGAVSEEAPVLLTAIHSLDGNTASELARLQPRRIVVMGGHAAVDDNVFELLRPFAAEEIVRVAGVDRFGTAAELSKDKFPNGAETAYIATGRSYPDALAGGLAASAEGAPVLLTEPNVLPEVTATELLRLGADRIVIIGGSGTVSRGLEALLADYAPLVERIAGTDRYETMSTVNERVVEGTDTAFIVTGKTFGDALTGIPIAALSRSAVLMVGDGPLHASVIAELDRLQPKTIIVLGGTGAVAESVEAQLAAYIGDGTGDGERGLQVDQDDVETAIAAMNAAATDRRDAAAKGG